MGLGCWSFQTLFLKMFHRFSIVFFKVKGIYVYVFLMGFPIQKNVDKNREGAQGVRICSDPAGCLFGPFWVA